ncbi:hypothetical protein L596_014277 [Steinernema carpocapsae]|uniref:Uncharacterized protein n=1 Tax=Steinernema carpocapsae TaxID=34508 RepID=A0A4U5NBE1_STECR|nr:hypothetical protein L596_014277 [Steinernema carpocapsae]
MARGFQFNMRISPATLAAITKSPSEATASSRNNVLRTPAATEAAASADASSSRRTTNVSHCPRLQAPRLHLKSCFPVLAQGNPASNFSAP